MAQPSAKHFKVQMNGHIIEYYDGRSELQLLYMRQLSQQASSLHADFKTAVQGLLPPSTALDVASRIPIQDDNVPSGPHAQKHNIAIVKPLQDQLRREFQSDRKHRLFSKDPKALKTWCRLDQHILSLLAMIFTISCGFSFRGWQLTGLTFHAADGSRRNLWILADGRVIVANPRAKQSDFAVYPTLLAFPADVSAILIFYFVILRPLACEALDGVAGYDISAYRTEIWARATARKGRKIERYRWTGTDISRNAAKFTDGTQTLQLAPFTMRQVAQAFYRAKFPLLFDHGLLSSRKFPVYQTISSELDRYSHTCQFQALCMPRTEAVGLLAVSEIWQAALGIGQVNYAWEYLVEGSYLFPSQKHRSMAFMHARSLVDQIYEVGSHGSETQISVNRILRQAPFLKGDVSI